MCKLGFYGNATHLVYEEEWCLPCECPYTMTEGGNFAQGCIVDELDSQGHICMLCLKGYEGDHCERWTKKYLYNPYVNYPSGLYVVISLL